MPKDQFDFKQFSIRQERCAMKVGTDGVLIGAWLHSNQSSCSQILDIGAGTGLISLMLAQRFPAAQIMAVEIDQQAAEQCQENFEASPWRSRLTILPHSLSDAESLFCIGQHPMFDHIVSNPPFFNATLKPEDEGRAVARHKDALPVAEIAAFAQHWLSPTGLLSLIYPTNYHEEVMTECIMNGMKPIRMCDVYTKVGKPCKRQMASFCRVNNKEESSMLAREELAIRKENGEYSDEYRHLVEDFYLRLA